MLLSYHLFIFIDHRRKAPEQNRLLYNWLHRDRHLCLSYWILYEHHNKSMSFFINSSFWYQLYRFSFSHFCSVRCSVFVRISHIFRYLKYRISSPIFFFCLRSQSSFCLWLQLNFWTCLFDFWGNSRICALKSSRALPLKCLTKACMRFLVILSVFIQDHMHKDSSTFEERCGQHFGKYIISRKIVRIVRKSMYLSCYGAIK